MLLKINSYINGVKKNISPNDLSLVCLYLSLYISFLLFGHFLKNFFFGVLKKNVQIIKKEIYNDKYRHTRDRLLFNKCNLIIVCFLTLMRKFYKSKVKYRWCRLSNPIKKPIPCIPIDIVAVNYVVFTIGIFINYYMWYTCILCQILQKKGKYLSEVNVINKN